jgi:hypothetical protein
MDWQEIAKKVMEGYDGATNKAFAAKRAGKVGAPGRQADPENDEDYPLDNQPRDPNLDEVPGDDNPPEPEPDADDKMDEETKRKLMALLQE